MCFSMKNLKFHKSSHSTYIFDFFSLKYMAKTNSNTSIDEIT